MKPWTWMFVLSFLAASCSTVSSSMPSDCEDVDCGSNGTCVVESGTATCACDPGFHPEGLSCVADPPACVDGDGDGHGPGCPDGPDCDDGDPAHWNDCPTAALFFDPFEYVVGRDDGASVARFHDQGGWSWAKTVQAGETGAKGYLYTVDRIPGYTGPFPGQGSQRVLAIESAGATFQGQTDFFVQLGGVQQPVETIPGDVWFQYWLYPNYYDDPNDQEDQLSDFGHRMKFIYPCRGNYPCQDGSWLYMMGATSDQPFFDNLGDPAHDVYVELADLEDIDYLLDAQYPTNRWKLGQTDISDLIARNRWTLVKTHIDTSTTSGRWETWIRPLGGQWRKVADWADGVDGLVWQVSTPGGHRMMRMPTVVGGGHGYYDFWLYMDDFAMAAREADLPVYPQ